MTEERRQLVLRAIVEGYVSTSEPVGSKTLSDHHQLGVSPATIRNDMAILEEEGLIVQPHTSAGRVPTDKGYRAFVDHLAAASLGDQHRRAISTFLSEAVDLTDVVERSVRLLAQLTRQVAVVQYPQVRESSVKRVELVHLGSDRVLAVIVSADGRVEQSTIAIGHDVESAEVDRVSLEINQLSTGVRSRDLESILSAWASQSDVTWTRLLVDAVLQATRGGTIERVVFAGTANLARARQDFESDAVGEVLDALEEQVVLLRLLHAMAEEGREVTVRIGHETQHDALSRTSIVAAGYGGGVELPSLVGALGPTRMNYPETIAAVRAVARYLSKVVDS